MQFASTITLSDVVVTLIGLGNIALLYFGVVRRLDSHGFRIKNLETRYEEMRRGTGLILESWPLAVQRCFGYRNGGG